MLPEQSDFAHIIAHPVLEIDTHQLSSTHPRDYLKNPFLKESVLSISGVYFTDPVLVRQMSHALYLAVLDFYSGEPNQIPTLIQSAIQLNSPRNPLRHESQHIKAIPGETNKTNSFVFLYFYYVNHNQLCPNAHFYYPTEDLHPKDAALALLAPTLLSALDVAEAIKWSMKSGDFPFILEVLRTVKTKPTLYSIESLIPQIPQPAEN